MHGGPCVVGACMVGGMCGRACMAGGMCGNGACMARKYVWQWHMHGRGCMAGGMHGRGVHGKRGMHSRGHTGGACVVRGHGLTRKTVTEASGTHPTGMHSCFCLFCFEIPEVGNIVISV